ncbi:MAG: hypothetical protein CXR30_06130 [Geobacter sp.]|nr:MAG: hypothetical protein CXR30_06130 [Geobacter sp.]
MKSKPLPGLMGWLVACGKASPAYFVLLLLLSLLAGCGSGNSGLPPSETLSSIAVTPAAKSVAPGTPVQFTAIGHYLDGTDMDVTDSVAWNSSDGTIATISNSTGSKGVATALVAGFTNITATLGNVSGGAAFTPLALVSITITPATTIMVYNPNASASDAFQFTATGQLSDGTSQDLTNLAVWSSSDNNVAFVSSSTGAAHAIGLGTATISATFAGALSTAAVTVQ